MLIDTLASDIMERAAQHLQLVVSLLAFFAKTGDAVVKAYMAKARGVHTACDLRGSLSKPSGGFQVKFREKPPGVCWFHVYFIVILCFLGGMFFRWGGGGLDLTHMGAANRSDRRDGGHPKVLAFPLKLPQRGTLVNHTAV